MAISEPHFDVHVVAMEVVSSEVVEDVERVFENISTKSYRKRMNFS